MMIPVIDFQKYSLGTDADVTEVQKLGKEVCTALETIGFCYIKNHGISEDIIEAAFKSSKEFFLQPEEEKAKYPRSQNYNFGWVGVEGERLNPEKPFDYKEFFNLAGEDHPVKWPTKPETFEPTITTLFDQCTELSKRIFDVISAGLNLEDKKFIQNCHQLIGKSGNRTTLRSLFYPALPHDFEPPKGQLRCGEHSDYGSLTLLFQDQVGGLEVRNTDDEFIPATPISGTAVVNIGDLMQRWTADRLKATKHRVMLPRNETQCGIRQSIAYFLQPDDDVIIECLDKSNKYPPISSLDYLNQCFSPTY